MVRLSCPSVVGYTEINFPQRELNPDSVTHPCTNRARRRVTSLIRSTSLPTAPNMTYVYYTLSRWMRFLQDSSRSGVHSCRQYFMCRWMNVMLSGQKTGPDFPTVISMVLAWWMHGVWSTQPGFACILTVFLSQLIMQMACSKGLFCRQLKLN